MSEIYFLPNPRRCKICVHPKREQINQQLKLKPNLAVAREFDINPNSIQRHFASHMKSDEEKLSDVLALAHRDSKLRKEFAESALKFDEPDDDQPLSSWVK